MILAKYNYYYSQFKIIPSSMEAGTPYESLKKSTWDRTDWIGHTP